MKSVLMEKREEVIANIRKRAAAGEFNAKVEVDDPKLTSEQKRELVGRFIDQYPTLRYRLKRMAARAVADAATRMVNRRTPVHGIEKIAGIRTGAIVTSNHFSPVDNTVVRTAVRRTGRRHMSVVGQEENLAMPALFGFLMRYADIIPISADAHYMRDGFEPMLRQRLEQGDFVLMYPEQEMWFNYRKPRPGKRGPYYYAAKFNVPVVSCFVEIVDRDDLEAPDFVEVGYAMHVLDPIYPDPAKTVRQNSFEMCARDYEQKRAAYERAYGKKLEYGFSQDDIAGWVPTEEAYDRVMGDACELSLPTAKTATAA